jgi:5-methylcytosine-specific restriction endonuclease McrA
MKAPTQIEPKALRYYKHNYPKLRRFIYGIYDKRCMKCESVNYLQIDHIKPRSKYPDRVLDVTNLQILCAYCNKEKYNIDETDYRKEKDFLALQNALSSTRVHWTIKVKYRYIKLNSKFLNRVDKFKRRGNWRNLRYPSWR